MLALVRWLPADAAVWVDEPAAWTLERELQAATLELLGEVLRATLIAGGVKRSAIPRSIKVPRPRSAVAERARHFDPYMFTAWLAAASK